VFLRRFLRCSPVSLVGGGAGRVSRSVALAASALHAGQDVLVGLHRERDVGVTEPFADDFHRDAIFDQQAAVRVAQIVKSDRRDVGVVHDPTERFVDGVGMDCLAVAVGDRSGAHSADALCVGISETATLNEPVFT
jgi:hypothetical protein